MSTSETSSFSIDTCPCGSGNIMKSVTTQDNPWSRADISYYNGCNKCVRNWCIEGLALLSEPQATQARAASNLYWVKRSELSCLVAPIVDEYFRELAATSMAAEHRAMSQIGISKYDIRNYRKKRKSGSSFSRMCDPLRNANWVEKLVSGTEIEGRYNELAEQLDQLDAKKEAAAAAVKRIHFSG